MKKLQTTSYEHEWSFMGFHGAKEINFFHVDLNFNVIQIIGSKVQSIKAPMFSSRFLLIILVKEKGNSYPAICINQLPSSRNSAIVFSNGIY